MKFPWGFIEFTVDWGCIMGCTGFGCYFFAGTLIPIIYKKSKSTELKPTYFFSYTWGTCIWKSAQSFEDCLVGLVG